ncbi:MAG: Fe-S cluster assembly protein SufD [Legionellaceae bacterium]|nr:Fe-S cluster assembly protein SufD [Legionellaceae bacterium]
MISEAWLVDLKKQAASDLEKLGLPTRQDEDWKYSATDVFAKQALPMADISSFVPDTTHGYPAGVLVLPLLEAFEHHADKIKPYLNQIMEQTHGFHAFNMANFQDGMFIYVPEGVQVDEPVRLLYTQTEAGVTRCLRHLVVAEARSSLVLVEDYGSDVHDAPYYTSVNTEIKLAAHAKLTHCKIQREGEQAFHVGEVAVEQAADSRFESHSVSLGGQWTRSDTVIKLCEPGASCLMNGLYTPTDNQHIDHHTIVKHTVPNCTSEQDYKGILNGSARAVFNGKVQVSHGAQKTDAKQYNKNILLSSKAEVDTKPQMEIFADDVVCAHGATVGQLDEEALFYLATRGIEAELAKHYLVQAFLTENIRNIAPACVQERVASLLVQHVEQDA